MLHILNGETTATILAATAVPGERLSFRDALINGPAPAGVSGPEWRRIRATHLANAYGVDFQKCERDLAGQEDVFASFPEHEEVVLWFESDLFCQLNMLYVLDWFGARDFGDTKLTMICIGEFPGRPDFRGLGELNPKELSSLFPQRAPLSRSEFEVAAGAWRAYRSPDPRAVENLLQDDITVLPFLRDALQLHLERFPSVQWSGSDRKSRAGIDPAGCN